MKIGDSITRVTTCSVCGGQTAEDAKFCQHCGDSLNHLTTVSMLQRIASTLDEIQAILERHLGSSEW